MSTVREGAECRLPQVRVGAVVQYASQEVRCAGGPKVEFGPSLNCAGGPRAESGPALERALNCAGGPEVEFGPALNCAGGPGAESGPAPERALSGPLALMLEIGPGLRIQLVPPSRCWRGSGTARPAQEQTPEKMPGGDARGLEEWAGLRFSQPDRGGRLCLGPRTTKIIRANDK